ncbi:general odorant-binding protein 19d-like [Anabrus simplex]|uniref:general odorant-binding protein 19d-like n=1 Tax=Anabrus simplex TaxID=316456 RepID=UPI0035A3638D
MKLDTSSIMVNAWTLSIFLALMCQYAAADYVENFAQAVRPLAEDCRKYVGASDADVEKVIELEVLTTQSQNCLLYCVFSKVGIMDGNTYASADDILKVYNSAHEGDDEFIAQGPKAVNECLDEASKLKTNDSCLLAYFLRQCVSDKSFNLVYFHRS